MDDENGLEAMLITGAYATGKTALASEIAEMLEVGGRPTRPSIWTGWLGQTRGTPGIPIHRTGTRGDAFANANPDVLGRKPVNMRVVIVTERITSDAASMAGGRPNYGKRSRAIDRLTAWARSP